MESSQVPIITFYIYISYENSKTSESRSSNTYYAYIEQYQLREVEDT